MKVGYAGSAHVNGNPVIESAGENETASAPLPVIGLDAVYGITQNWYLVARGQYFGLDFDDYSGDLTDLRLMTEYRIGRTFGIGIGYTWYNIDFTRDRGDYQVGIEYDYSGAEAAFLKVWF